MNDLFGYIDAQKEQACRLLTDLIAFPSAQGNETQIQQYLCQQFGQMGLAAELVAIKDRIKEDPEYSWSDSAPRYQDRPNLAITLPGRGHGRSLIFNTHADVVPAGDWAAAFSPRREGETVYGRGACDAKGQIVVLYLVLAALQACHVRPKGDVSIQIVIEEEVGGNGSLSLLRDGRRADGVIVLEPTSLHFHPACRGAVWFRISVEGKSVHMGRIDEGISAIDNMMEVIGLLKQYEHNLLEESCNHPLFQGQVRPIQMNIGTIQGGDWPSMVPGWARIEGAVGFLPNKTLQQIKTEVQDLITEKGNDWLKKHCLVEFPKLHNDAYEIPLNHHLVETMGQCCQALSLPSEITGWPVSCDARLFAKVGHMPVLVFGPGCISYAHSALEQINIQDILAAAKTLILLIRKWCA